jgi:Protein of unknown function (DUF732)
VKLLKTTLLALLAAPILMLSSGVAHADDASFLADMEAAGFVNHAGKGAEIDVGHGICNELARGWTQGQAIRDLWFNGANSMDESAATRFVSIAVKDLCQAYSSGAGGNP